MDCEKNWSPRHSATGSYSRQAGRQADEIILALEIFKILQRANFDALGLFEQRYSILSSITSIVVGFLCSDFYNVVYSLTHFSRSHTFPCQSLLLSTNVLNDT